MLTPTNKEMIADLLDKAAVCYRLSALPRVPWSDSDYLFDATHYHGLANAIIKESENGESGEASKEKPNGDANAGIHRPPDREHLA